MNRYSKLAHMIQESEKIAVLTGAGISVDSGIPDFRTSQGAFWLENEERVNLMSIDYWRDYPEEFWPIFKDIFKIKMVSSFQPNEGHLFLTELEASGKMINIFTQNVDGLHREAGSSFVFEMHGTIKTATCTPCQRKYKVDYLLKEDVPRCQHCLKVLKPDVVLFGDAIHHYIYAQEYISECDLLLVMGTSLQVSPVNALPLLINRNRGQQSAIINLHPTSFDHEFDLVIHEGITETVRQVKKALV